MGFDAPGSFSLSDGCEFGTNVIILDANLSSSRHIENKRKYILISPTDGLDDTTLTTEKENFTEQQKKIC